jgi:hypothetical protein
MFGDRLFCPDILPIHTSSGFKKGSSSLGNIPEARRKGPVIPWPNRRSGLREKKCGTKFGVERH